MDRPLAPPVADSRLSRALSACACGTLLLVVPVRLDEMAALLGAALRETVLQAAARQLETALHTLQQPATGAEALAAVTAVRLSRFYLPALIAA